MPKSDETRESLSRIEATLSALCGEVGAIRERVEKLDGQRSAMTKDEIISFLDGYRAAEDAAATALGAWIAVSDTPCLRGGLRAVQLREASHARLFEERIKELGGSVQAELPEGADVFFAGLGDPNTTDAQKVAYFMAQAGDPKVLDQLDAQAARMGDDEETQFLLRCVIEDERATLGLLQQAEEMLCG